MLNIPTPSALRTPSVVNIVEFIETHNSAPASPIYVKLLEFITLHYSAPASSYYVNLLPHYTTDLNRASLMDDNKINVKMFGR